MSEPREDWLGSDLDNGTLFEVRRCFNGIMVLKALDYSRDTVTSGRDILVFQDFTQFVDWAQHWFKGTKNV